MLTARRETVLPSSTALWCPGHKFEGFTPVAQTTSRAEQILKCRNELLSLLQDAPESEFELSLTDLVVERSQNNTGRDEKDREPQQQQSSVRMYSKASVKEGNCVDGRTSRRSTRSRSTGSDGVLLNMFVPKSLGRSFTWSHSRPPSSLRKNTSDNTQIREKESPIGCWPNLWNIGKTKAERY